MVNFYYFISYCINLILVQKILDKDILCPVLALLRDHKIESGVPTAENFRIVDLAISFNMMS
jgi:hypothetical protein